MTNILEVKKKDNIMYDLEHTQQITNILHDNSSKKVQLYNLVHQCDLKTCDLLHEIELTDIKGMYHAWLIIKELKEVRQIRRKAKDELEVWRVVNNFKKAPEKMQYKNVMDVIRIRTKQLKHRYYHPRFQEKIQDHIKVGE